METIPTVMESVMLSEQGRDKLEYGCMDIPVPRKGQVLIKVVAVPINPTDLYMMEGKYGKYMNLQYPHTPGFEGAGYVVQSGGGILAWRLKGKRVAFTRMDQRMVGGKLIKIGGSMAQYCLTNAYQ